MREVVIVDEDFDTAEDVTINLDDTVNYPQLRRIEGRLPVDFIHFSASAAMSLFVNQDVNRHFMLFSAGSLEVGDAKAYSVRIRNDSGADDKKWMLRLVCR